MPDENDPQVQRNGFRAVAEKWDIPDDALEEFFRDHFDPSRTFAENRQAFFDFFDDILSAVSSKREELSDGAES